MPDKPLNFNPKKLTHKELKRFLKLAEQLEGGTAESIDAFDRLLAAASDWTYQEIENSTTEEIEAALAKMKTVAEVEEEAVPPPIESSCDAGPPEPAT